MVRGPQFVFAQPDVFSEKSTADKAVQLLSYLICIGISPSVRIMPYVDINSKQLEE